MELVLWCESSNRNKVKEILKKDDVVSRASIIEKEASIVNKEGYYFYINGTEEQINKAKEIVQELAEIVEGNEKDQVIKKIKDEEEKALEGFGAILG